MNGLLTRDWRQITRHSVRLTHTCMLSAIPATMVKQYYGVAIGRVPGIYKTWSMANTQVEGFSSACHGGFDDIQECVDFMIAKGDFNEDTIHVYGQRGGQYTLRNWQRKLGEKNNEDKSAPPSSEGCVPAGLVVQLPSSPAKPPAHHADIMIPTSLRLPHTTIMMIRRWLKVLNPSIALMIIVNSVICYVV